MLKHMTFTISTYDIYDKQCICVMVFCRSKKKRFAMFALNSFCLLFFNLFKTASSHGNREIGSLINTIGEEEILFFRPCFHPLFVIRRS